MPCARGEPGKFFPSEQYGVYQLKTEQINRETLFLACTLYLKDSVFVEAYKSCFAPALPSEKHPWVGHGRGARRKQTRHRCQLGGHSPASPPARYSPAQPCTARHSPVQPGTARHSPVQSGTTRHGAARRGAGAPRCARASPPRQEPPGSVSRRLLAKLPRCLGLGSPVPPPLPRGKSPAPPINFLMSREPGKGSQQHGLNPLTPHPRIPTGTPMTDLFTVIVLPDNARFPRNFGSLGCILFGNIFENAPSAPRFSQS